MTHAWQIPEIIKAGHIEVLVTDIKKAKEFYVETLGFVVTSSDEEHIFLRGYEERYHHSLLLTLAEKPGVGHFAFRVREERDLERIISLARRKGLRAERFGSEKEKGLHFGARIEDPFGFPVEFYCEMKKEDWLIRSYNMQKGAKISRLDHFNLLVPDVSSAFNWYTQELGFICTELTELENGQDIWAAWLRRKHTCHDVALMTGKGPRVHHAGFTVPDRVCIMDTADILASSGYIKSMERGPGRHGISNAFFLYLRDDDGNRIELYTGDYLSADPDWEPIKWKLNDPQRQTFWGSPAPDSWFNEAMPVMSFFTSQFIPLKEPSIVDRPTFSSPAH